MTTQHATQRQLIRDTRTPVGRVLGRLELVCLEILADEVPNRGPVEWCRRLIIKCPCGTPAPITKQARRLALSLNVFSRDEAKNAASRLLARCELFRAQQAAGEQHGGVTRGFRLRASRTE